MGAELGKYKSCVSARSTDKELLRHAQDGGIVTQLFAFALDEGIIDGAIVAANKEFAQKYPSKVMADNSNLDVVEPWRPFPAIVTTKAEMLAAAGTRYNLSPNVSLIKEATRSFGLDKVGIVGTPCQMQAIRKLQTVPDRCPGCWSQCRSCSRYFLHGELPVPEHSPARGRPRSHEDGIRQEDGDWQGQVLGLRQARTDCPAAAQGDPQVPSSPAATSVLTMLQTSVTSQPDSVGSPDGWSTVFVRSKIGDSVWGKAMAAGCFETQPIEKVKPGLELVTKLANEKISKNKKTLEERASFGVGKALRNPYI